MLNQNYDPQDLVVDIKNVCSDYDSSVISSSIKVKQSGGVSGKCKYA